MKKRGFTLIELLAVVLILGIITLIAVPIVNNIIKNTRKDAFKDTVLGLIEASGNKCRESTYNSIFEEVVIEFNDGKEITDTNFKEYYNGTTPDVGTINMSETCDISVAIYDNRTKTCATKKVNEDDVTLKDVKDSSECNL